MANIRKSFNFRNGVQVDNDNFVVNANGLVGIGTTIPEELLDIRGDVRISGIVSASQIVSFDLSLVNADISNKLNVGIVSIVSGVVTSSSSTGIITYFGDGGNLINLPTSQWIDVDPGFGYSSIYSAGNVGVGTTFPNFSFQVGGDPNFSNGLGINSEGGVYSTGIITAGFFNGDGFLVTNITADNITSGTLSANRLPTIPNSNLPSNISVSGIITAQSGFVGNITGNVNSTGLSTFSGGIIGSVTGDVVGNVTGNVTGDITGDVTGDVVGNVTGNVIGNLSGSVFSPGISTFNGGIEGNLTGNVTGDITGNVLGNILSLGISTFLGGINADINGDITGNVTGDVTGNIFGNLTGSVFSPGISTFNGGIEGNLTGNVTGDITGDVVGIADTARDLTSDARVTIDHINSQTSESGINTISSRLDVFGTIGINTDSPQSDIHIVNDSEAYLQLTAVESTIIVGSNLNPTENSGGIRFGNQSSIYQYSTSNSLDIINYDEGNLNYYLSYGIGSLGTGNFNWIYGPDESNPLMSLTYDGNLGIGITDPTDKLEVAGNTIIRQDLTVDQNIFAIGAGSSTSVQTLYIIDGTSGLLDSNGNQIIGPSNQNIDVASGISTFFNIQIDNNAVFNGNIGVRTENPEDPIQIGAATTLGDYVSISEYGIGLGTAANSNGFFIDALSKEVLFGAVSIGSTEDVLDIPTNKILYVEGDSEFNGNVGIGTDDPTSSLTVVGDANITGIVTSMGGFTSGVGVTNPVKITVSGNILTFNVIGVGSTSLLLY
jgi:hypothetical protein